MKLATEPYDEAPKERGISRMIVLSAVLHVVVIGILLATGQLHTTPPREPLSTSYEVSLIGPTGAGKAKAIGEKPATPARSAEEKPTPAPPAKGDPRAALPPKLAEPAKPKVPEPPQKPVEKPVEPAKLKAPEKPKLEEPVKPKPQEPPKPVEQAKLKVKEPPVEKPREVAKEREPEKPKPTPVVKEKEPPKLKPAPVVKEPEPPKVVAAAKPVEKKLPPIKEKAERKVPDADVQLPEKQQKAKVKEPSPTEPVKGQEKKPEVKKSEEPPTAKPASSQPEKKQSSEKVKATTSTKNPSSQKSEKVDPVVKKQPVTAPAEPTATSSSEDAVQARQDEEAREKLIASAVERVRSREESVSRERDIAKAIDRVRGNTNGQVTSGQEKAAKPAPAPSMNIAKGNEHDQGGKAKVYGPEFMAYTENIKQRVKDGWILPDRKPGLRAVVRFGVEADGGVTDVELVDPSGDRAFDQSALRAVRSAKLPPPPETYREDFALQKVHITFGGEE